MAKMKILWVCNISVVETKGNMEYWCGGWMTSTIKLLEKREDMELLVCYPQSKTKLFKIETKGKIQLCGFYVENRNVYSEKLEHTFRYIDRKYNPEVVMIFGTEFPHSLSAIRVWREKAVISLQGIIGVYAKHYFTGIPTKVVYRRKVLNGKKNSIYSDMLELEKKGVYERETLKLAKYVSGRTDWDYACVRFINDHAQYFVCNRILRSSFYEGRWEYDKCIKHSILISQADYPVKGFHIFVKALRLIKRKFPDVRVVVAGYPLNLDKDKGDSYACYILELLERYQLKENVKVAGVQSEESMKQLFLSTNVFVSPSLIENAPNSLGEAMILGVPSVASDVGGVSGMIRHGEEGFVYQADAEYMLAHYVIELFENQPLAEEFSAKAREHALKTHDQEENMKTLLQIYENVRNGITLQ